MEFTLTIKGDAPELAALLSQIKVPTKAVATASVPLNAPAGLIESPAAPDEAPVAEAPVVTTPPAATNGQVKPTRTRKPATVVTVPEDAPSAVELAYEAEDQAIEASIKAEQAAKSGPGTTISKVEVKLDDLRKLMHAKLSHSAQIVEWLAEFGSPNLSKLDPAHYEAMYSKLNSLK